MPSNAAAEPGPGLPELVLRAARDLDKVGTAFDAELLFSTLLGSVYAGSLPDRAMAMESFGHTLREYLSGTDTGPSRVAARVLDALTEGADRQPDRGAGGPVWLSALGAVRVTGGYAYGDRYGDQTSYLITYAYRDEPLGGPEHAVVILVDHNLGLVKDLVIAAPASAMLDRLRESVITDEAAMTWLAEVDPATVRAASIGYLRATDTVDELPESESLTSNWAMARARLAMVEGAPVPADAPPAPEVDREGLISEFLNSPEARIAGLAGASGERREAVTYSLGLVIDFADTRGGDPLRWSPRAVEVFLLDWVHGRAVLDSRDTDALPDALGAWVLWAGRRLGLPDVALQATFDEVGAVRAEFARLCATGERQSPAVRATARLIAEGVDLADEQAVDAWLRTYQSDN
ncbi:hypothetical protein [Rugosimonospora africana]|uniref:Uncharacterized protein n=1 Tax=Rugosimonospora africana TaxID=556532 RepID=A0A8J3QNK0_9ACTN|nr:hypothetical protein [Rugosimonospora africana]GIH13307.1 hypothetical protein Raf01_14790 [Rugosimonospora africana]